MTQILFVEDDPFISEIYTKKFTASGFVIEPAFTGREAVKKIQAGSFDLVMLDLVIPELSGMDVLRELRTNRDFDPGLKVIVFSNLTDPQDRQAALAAGANGFISKTSFNPSEVVLEVQRYLEQFAAEEKHGSAQAISSTGIDTTNVTTDAQSGVVSQKQILLIEDEAVFAEMFGKALQDGGYAVVTETDGQKGLALAQAGGFDLIITDFALPSLNGQDIITALRQDGRSKQTPIFLLTASLAEEAGHSLETSGVVERALLKTQVTPSELTVMVREVLSGT